MPSEQQPIGVVLAGGRGVRMGGSKLTVALRGEPLIAYPLRALRAVLAEVAVIGKPDLELPDLDLMAGETGVEGGSGLGVEAGSELRGVLVWIEPQEPHHPLVGIVEALALAGGRAVLVCAADLPFVTPALIRRLVEAGGDGPPAVIACSPAGDPQPLLGRYEAEAAGLLAPAASESRMPVREAVAAIGPRLLEVADEQELFNVNSPDDLLLAAAMMDRRDRAR
jgi:molybdopterin-guanine dinucleotide biosynthesis protein A